MQSRLFGDLAVENAEIVFPLLNSIKPVDLADTDSHVTDYLEQDKQLMALQLFIAYRDGVGVVANEQIAEVYLAQYLLCPKPSESSFDNVLFWFSWFTTLRLGVLRGDRELALLPFSSQHDHPIQFNKALQLSYLLEIIVGMAKLFYYSFRPETKEDYNAGIPWYTRLKERFSWERYDKIRNSSQFTNFMSNAIVWFIINGLSLACIAWLSCLGASALVILIIPSLIQLTGFAYDIYHDYEYAAEERANHKKSHLLVESNIQEDDDTKITLKNILKNKALNNFSASSEKVSRVVKIAIGIFIGMALLYFLPLLSPYIAAHLPLLGTANFLLSYDAGKNLVDIVTEIIKTLGSTIVVAAGFVYGGLCGRLWRLASWTASASWLWDFLTSNSLNLLAAGLLLHFGITAAIPLIGATIVGLGTPIAFLLTLIAIKGIINIGKQIWQCLQPPPPPSLSSQECTKLNEILFKFSDIPDSNLAKTLRETFSNEERLLLKKASGLNDDEWLKHIRNWSLPDKKREISLSYKSLKDLRTELVNKFNLSKERKNDMKVTIFLPLPTVGRLKEKSSGDEMKINTLRLLLLSSPRPIRSTTASMQSTLSRLSSSAPTPSPWSSASKESFSSPLQRKRATSLPIRGHNPDQKAGVNCRISFVIKRSRSGSLAS